MKFLEICYIINLYNYFIFIFIARARDSLPKRKERIMKNEKQNYTMAEIEIAKFSSQDIVTASSADSFDYVDDNAWDT